jgi:hypothetical protein
MKLQRNSDGSYVACYDGSKKALLELADHLSSIAHAGVGAEFSLVFHGLLYNFESPRELWSFASGIAMAMQAPFIEKMETHISSIVGKIYDLGYSHHSDDDIIDDPAIDSPDDHNPK